MSLDAILVKIVFYGGCWFKEALASIPGLPKVLVTSSEAVLFYCRVWYYLLTVFCCYEAVWWEDCRDLRRTSFCIKLDFKVAVAGVPGPPHNE